MAADVSQLSEEETLKLSLDFGELNLTCEDFLLDEVDVHIQENLEDDLVKEALKTGVDLRQYSKQVESELLAVENDSIQDYIKESQNIASLHKQIAACDTILERMEGMLNGFQSDLSSISNEIQTLQDQSIAMNIKLKNRQAVRGELSQFVDEMVVPQLLITTILDAPVTEREFLEQLQELNHKINFVKEQSFKDARSCSDVKDVLEKLKIKAIAKIREYLLQKIYQFRKPMTNYQIPQNALLKFRFYNEFLMTNERHVAREVRDEYVDTMSKLYLSYFKGYSSRLMKLQFEELAEKDDLIAAEDTAKKGFFSSKPSLKNRSTIFTIGRRDVVLNQDLEAPIIVPHTTQKSETKCTFESLFRSLMYALMDNCCREYLFISDFFMMTHSSAQDLFNTIMGKTLTMFLKQFEAYAAECYDSIALFLSIHLVYRYQSIMEKREVPALDKYWDTLLQLLWVKFEYIIKLNIESVRLCDPHKLGDIDMMPHYITRRYAEFSAGIVGINESFPDDRVSKLFTQLQTELDSFILKMAAKFPHRREQLIFLINNYDMMLGVIVERTTEDSTESESFREMLTARTQEFIEEILSPHFGGLMSFVKDCEALVERGDLAALNNQEKVSMDKAWIKRSRLGLPPMSIVKDCEALAERGDLAAPNNQERRVQQIVRAFNNDWKKAIDKINEEIVRSFSNFRNGTQILQGALTQMIQYYHRFQKILSQNAFRNLPIKNELISIHHIMVEVKKHKPTF